MSGLQMRDISRTGHELGRARMDDLPAVVSLGELLRIRIRSEADRYNLEPGPVFEGLVQPPDSVRHRDGHHMQVPRPLDADQLVAAAEEAVATDILYFVIGDEEVTDLAHQIDTEQQDEIIAVLRRPIVARSASLPPFPRSPRPSPEP